ncbi:MAG: UDP-N-acetylglucosamine 1-carboxyvinyltransferase [Candidatus Amesbacteria bacterium GW2011_GWB1_47_19]|nr:MAG: UDP-N-acetylglucosamine 1-carboxyvinyltransferase [Candidatus Amesbacteria bacterium GW2011_GWA1_44_24]KKU31938.1 MAG: UDP-N-acetylglucosamine 1-carboxyvinyltransferase, UDP-N-acetylglucosamine 1-carboxyvinyltransferase [Candidatus Amesbacteria bacterium GW2011_GWC1_46_24]KKU66874.1 MAG: UDP-N-acetylglucosamine 1-carboxyvinyltransferase [Candidatus Amesbacteria bacterium GW2011_GWB1_47_19]
MAASLLADGPVTLTRAPVIRDVSAMAEILESLGAKVTGLATPKITIDPRGCNNWEVSPELSRKVRSSVMFLSPLLAKFGRVKIGFPGGDVIGKRAIGTHLDALTRLGAKFDILNDTVSGSFTPPKQPVAVFLDEASVTATENALILASTQPNTTTIEDAACEPHVGDLGQFLTRMGAEITGLGSGIISVLGTPNLKAVTYPVSPDYIDAGTFAIAAAATGGTITISPVDPKDLRMILLYLSRFGVKYSWPKSDTLKILPSRLSVDPEKLGIRQKFQTRPWPGFPTDLLSPLIVLATQTQGTVLMHDWMYETRMFFTDKLVAMGANITLCDPHRCLVTGPTPLVGRHLASPDIRAGMSILIAALAAEGESIIDHAEIIERGYEDPASRFASLGAKIERVDRHD